MGQMIRLGSAKLCTMGGKWSNVSKDPPSLCKKLDVTWWSEIPGTGAGSRILSVLLQEIKKLVQLQPNNHYIYASLTSSSSRGLHPWLWPKGKWENWCPGDTPASLVQKPIPGTISLKVSPGSVSQSRAGPRSPLRRFDLSVQT